MLGVYFERGPVSGLHCVITLPTGVVNSKAMGKKKVKGAF